MRAKGYTQRDVLQTDVQKAYAEGIGNMTINGSGGSTTGDMLGIGIGLAAAGHIAPKIGDMFSGIQPNQQNPVDSWICSCGNVARLKAAPVRKLVFLYLILELYQ